MGFLSHRVKRSDLEAGDHIYTWRTPVFAYSHHGIYIGEGKVVHFTQVEQSAFSSLVGDGWRRCSACKASDDTRNEEHRAMVPYQRCTGRVMMSCLDCFLGGGSLYRYDYSVSKFSYWCKVRGGTCTMEGSSRADVVIDRALHHLKNGFGEYNVFTNNCEDFARYCKTGQNCSKYGRAGSGSSQASSFFGKAAAATAFAASWGSGSS